MKSNDFNTINNSNNEKWKEYKIQEKQQVFDMLDKATSRIANNLDNFKDYLDVQSQFDRYSVSNALLIMDQMPHARELRDYNGWHERKAYIKPHSKSIKILEPRESYVKEDGTTAVSYLVKKMFDISQTTFLSKKEYISLDERTLLKAFLDNSSVEIKVVEEIENGEIVRWNDQENVLYITKGANTNLLFNSLAHEFGKIEFENLEFKNYDDFQCKCVAYLVCKKYGIDVSSISLKELPQNLADMSPKEVRNELAIIRTAMENINLRLDNYLERISKDSKNQEYER